MCDGDLNSARAPKARHGYLRSRLRSMATSPN